MRSSSFSRGSASLGDAAGTPAGAAAGEAAAETAELVSLVSAGLEGWVDELGVDAVSSVVFGAGGSASDSGIVPRPIQANTVAICRICSSLPYAPCTGAPFVDHAIPRRTGRQPSSQCLRRQGEFHFDVAMKLRTSDVRSMGICSNANTSVQRSGRSEPHRDRLQHGVSNGTIPLLL